jgi:hypothetical protein
MGTLRKIKRELQSKTPENLKLLERLAYERGWNAGALDQRKMDIKFLAKLLVELENYPGIGEKTADKVRHLILRKFGNQ